MSTAPAPTTNDPAAAAPAAPTPTKQRVIVCRVSELPPGERKIVQVGKRSIGVFNIKGEYFAIRNLCPHQLAPLCLGKVTGYNEPGAVGEFNWQREGEIIRCPWHAWEFDIKTGKSIFNPHKVKTGTYQVSVISEDTEARDGGTPPCDMRDVAEGEEPAVEKYAVGVEDGVVILHL